MSAITNLADHDAEHWTTRAVRAYEELDVVLEDHAALVAWAERAAVLLGEALEMHGYCAEDEAAEMAADTPGWEPLAGTFARRSA